MYGFCRNTVYEQMRKTKLNGYLVILRNYCHNLISIRMFTTKKERKKERKEGKKKGREGRKRTPQKITSVEKNAEKNQNPCVLLVGMENGAATLENHMEVPI